VVASCVVWLGEALRDTQSINIFNDTDSFCKMCSRHVPRMIRAPREHRWVNKFDGPRAFPCIAFRLRHLASCSGFADFIGPCFRLLEILVEVLLRVVGFDKLSPNLDSLRLSPLE